MVTDAGTWVSYAGALGGVKYGASIGCCAPPWEPIIGGAIGGIVGGIGANWLIDEFYLNWE